MQVLGAGRSGDERAHRPDRVFGLSVIGWTLTKLNDTFVALLAAIGLVLLGTLDADGFFASIGNSVVWLMIGAFIVARALNHSGLAVRFTYAMTHSSRTPWASFSICSRQCC